MQAISDTQNLSLRNSIVILFCQFVSFNNNNLSVLLPANSFAFYYRENPNFLLIKLQIIKLKMCKDFISMHTKKIYIYINRSILFKIIFNFNVHYS